MLKKEVLPIGAAICFLAGLFTIIGNDTADAAECLASPNRPSGPGTHWHYRINQTTKQRCWYLKQVGGRSRPRPTAMTRVAPAPTVARPRPAEAATPAPAESESSIKAWFSATFSALSGAGTNSSTETREPSANESTPTRKRRAPDRPEQSKAERSEQSKAARAQQQPSAAAISEAAGEKDIATSSADSQPEWQKTLFEEFLQWRVQQELMPQALMPQ